MSATMTARALLAGAGLLATAGAAAAQDKVTVAYFLEWPTANQVAQVEKTYDKEMGVEVEWRAFGTGTEMNQAMVDALQATDEATQKTNWEKAQQLIAADLPTLPLVSAKTPSAGATYVKGFVPSPALLEFFASVWLDK